MVGPLEVIVTAGAALGRILQDLGYVLTCEVVEAIGHATVELVHVVGVVIRVSVEVLVVVGGGYVLTGLSIVHHWWGSAVGGLKRWLSG